MREAIAIEQSTPKPPVTPAPTLPAQELLGDLLVEQQHPKEALAGYEQSLKLYPKRFNSLLGAARASRATGDAVIAQRFSRALLQIAACGSRRMALEEAQAFAERKN